MEFSAASEDAPEPAVVPDAGSHDTPSRMMTLAVQARTLGSTFGNRSTGGGDMGAVIEVGSWWVSVRGYSPPLAPTHADVEVCNIP